MPTFIENIFLLLLLGVVLCAFAAGMAWLGDWLDEHFPWE